LDYRRLRAATDAIPLSQPKPWALREHFVVPSIRSLRNAEQWTNTGLRKRRLEPLAESFLRITENGSQPDSIDSIEIGNRTPGVTLTMSNHETVEPRNDATKFRRFPPLICSIWQSHTDFAISLRS
jgi:hypothetical protein